MFSQTELLAEAIVPLINRASRQAPYLSQPGSHCLPHSGDSLRPCSTQIWRLLKLFPMAFPNKWPVLAHGSYFPKISPTRSIWPQHVSCILPSGLKPGNSNSQSCLQLGFTWSSPNPAQVAAIGRTFCSSCRAALDRTQASADLGLQLPS